MCAQELVSRHAALTTDYLLANSDEFFRAFNALFASKNYVTKRQSIKARAACTTVCTVAIITTLLT